MASSQAAVPTLASVMVSSTVPSMMYSRYSADVLTRLMSTAYVLKPLWQPVVGHAMRAWPGLLAESWRVWDASL